MKTNIVNSSISLGLFILLGACSTKRDSFLSRNTHALSTKYNILYNGQIGLDKGVAGINANDQDNFWRRLPIEKMQFNEELVGDKKTKNPDFEIAESKATKAIQKHSMNIDGTERNFQTDEAYLLLGKSRYYDQRFIPALDAFNYILYKYPNSSRIYEAKIWREKTNMRLGNDALVVNNMKQLLDGDKLKKQIKSDANALLSEAYLNLEEKDSAVAKLVLAENFSNNNQQKARYRFILGQLYEELNSPEKALESYESIIAMNRKSERKYVIQAQAKKAQLFDFKNGDTLLFVETFNKLLKDRENRPFLDVLNHQFGLFYDKQDDDDRAKKYYNASLKMTKGDEYLMASNYRNIANRYFKDAKYPMAAKYYDSTLTKLNNKTREFIHLSKVRKDLDDVILYEAIAVKNDSIISILNMTVENRETYFKDYITQLKAEDEKKQILIEKQLQIQKNIAINNGASNGDNAISDPNSGISKPNIAMVPPSINTSNQQTPLFYFYNPSTVAYGKVAFKKNWGTRTVGSNWRLNSGSNNQLAATNFPDDNEVTSADNEDEIADNPAYNTDFYLSQLPTDKKEIDSINKERNFAYYQLGIIYKEKFKEYDLASNKLEQLLRQNPEQKLVLPTLYNLYKIYQITNQSKALEVKQAIITQFPDSRYAQIISNSKVVEAEDSPEGVYDQTYALYDEEKFDEVLEKTDVLINQFAGDEIVSKFEFLRANAIGKLRGLAEYKKAVQYVADNYPNTEEGKKSMLIIESQIPALERLSFNNNASKNWKILYRVSKVDNDKSKAMALKVKKFIQGDSFQQLTYRIENYNENEQFLIIQGAQSDEYATVVSNLLKSNKEFKIEETPIILSNENYNVIQIKKNLDAYEAFKKQ
ncbi:type IX secretion system periplasmic lipoprotein PorW/SprE [Flavobacterium algicola]|uniref:type IX secretion system periplasmic lipoprotein PorW/SprE n=1 Tax=Flavobacterium algicola TaxID=556529 RepID=UPI001EFDDF5F|nr:tetratricopeptide repeat protein [Flavobacterium algicola]MCG9791917.1 tetratricopeptide repeat protein [Flavobacterium algicola]